MPAPGSPDPRAEPRDPPDRPAAGTADAFPEPVPVLAVVLAGGGSRRWGGVDKTAADLDGRCVLARVVHGLPAGLPVLVVGPDGHPFAAADAGSRPVRRTREDPPGGGPVAGLAAACRILPRTTATLVLLAGDLPFAGTAVPRLLDRLAGSAADVALGIDPDGRIQPLLAAYRVPPLTAVLAGIDDPAGLPLRRVLSGLEQVPVPVTAREAFDLDTPADLDTARSLLR